MADHGKRKTIVVEQIGSPIRRPHIQRATLIGLGLNKMHKRRTLIDSLQVRGTLVSNGTTSGPVVIDTMTLATKGSLWVTRPAMVHYATPRSHMLAMADELFALVLAGKITGEPQRVLALAEAAEAHRALESRKTTGATVLVP